MKVLFVTVLYMPRDMPSDKQFIRDVIASMPQGVDAVMWTVNDWPPIEISETMPNRSLSVCCSSRLLHKPRYDDAILKGEWSYSPHRQHRTLRQLIELTSSFYAYALRFKKIVDRERPDIIHVTDTWGPIGWCIRRIAGRIPITCAKPAARTDAAAGPLYRFFLRACLTGNDKVVCFTDACREELVKAGMPRQKLATIPWGIKVPSGRPSAEVTSKIRARYRCREGDLLVVVAMQAHDRHYARVVGEVAAMSTWLPIKAVLAVKPDHWREQYLQYASGQLTVVKGPEDFHDLLWAADVMFSPTYDRFQYNSATPPLTWLEAMIRETVVVTTDGIGVRESIMDGKTGVLYNNTADLHEKIALLAHRGCLRTLKESACRSCMDRHSVPVIALQYLTLWQSLSNARSRRFQHDSGADLATRAPEELYPRVLHNGNTP